MSKSTREQVRELAEKMLSEGVWPTTTPILDILGGGSKRTIQDELDRWRLEILPLLAKAIVQMRSPSPVARAPQNEDKIAALRAELLVAQGERDEARHKLDLAFDRFESFEDRMFNQMNTAREADTKRIEKLEGEVRRVSQDWSLAEDKWIARERTLCDQLRKAGIEPDA